MSLESINTEQRLYVMPCGKGYSCYGFDVLFDKSTRLAAWLVGHGSVKVQDVRREDVGTERAFEVWEILLDRARKICELLKIRCDIELTPQLIGLEGKRVEVIDDSGDKRRFIVGKSTGWMPCHLEIARRDSSGGGAVYGAPFKSVRIVRSS